MDIIKVWRGARMAPSCSRSVAHLLLHDVTFRSFRYMLLAPLIFLLFMFSSLFARGRDYTCCLVLEYKEVRVSSPDQRSIICFLYSSLVPSENSRP